MKFNTILKPLLLAFLLGTTGNHVLYAATNILPGPDQDLPGGSRGNLAHQSAEHAGRIDRRAEIAFSMSERSPFR